jgi:c(7)-type cytochrome triheme protein
MTRRILIVLCVLAGALLTAVGRRAATVDGWTETNDAKSLKFSHSFHVKDAGVACEDCHGAAKTSTRASDNLRSNHDNCISCHEDQITNACGYCHVNPEAIEAAPSPVRTIMFSHKQHVTDQGVACATCHPGVESVDYVTAKNMPTMTACATCHDDVKATNVCESCHTSFTGLVPSDHLAADFKKDHKKLARVGGMDVSCTTCHTQSFCADCHVGGGLVRFGEGDLMTDPSPRTSTADAPAQMTLTMTHSLNYRFTHGIDAKAKSADCYSCHSAQTFCAPCHATGGNISGQPFKPAWHLGAGFTTLGVGSRGGRHAEYAKRDIESCVSCHDVQGGDPTCITCHRDADGIRGTDPKTHPAGYMKGEHGPWHTSQGATCFNCHTDFNARPDGVKGRNFCGYCHG